MSEKWVHIKSDDQVGAYGHERTVGMYADGRLFILPPEEEQRAELQWRLFSSKKGGLEFRLPVGRDLTVIYENPLECEGGMVESASGMLNDGEGCVLSLRSITYQGQKPRNFEPGHEGLFYIGIVPGIQITDTQLEKPLFSFPLNTSSRQNKA